MGHDSGYAGGGDEAPERFDDLTPEKRVELYYQIARDAQKEHDRPDVIADYLRGILNTGLALCEQNKIMIEQNSRIIELLKNYRQE